MTEKAVPVGLGKLVVTRDREAVLTAYGIGACVAVAVYDPRSGVAGLLHAALPLNAGGVPQSGKYVDSGLTALLTEMVKAGAKKDRLLIRLAGGSNMLTAPGFSNVLNVGRHNAAAVELVAAREGLTIAAADVGGHSGRTVRLYAGNGVMTVQVLGQEPKVLGNIDLPTEVTIVPWRSKPITGSLRPMNVAGG